MNAQISNPVATGHNDVKYDGERLSKVGHYEGLTMEDIEHNINKHNQRPCKFFLKFANFS
jgi:hypothetical protein